MEGKGHTGDKFRENPQDLLMGWGGSEEVGVVRR